jgi:hypothetical protein
VGYAAGTYFLVGIPTTCNYSVRYGVPLLPRSGLYKTYRSYKTTQCYNPSACLNQDSDSSFLKVLNYNEHVINETRY